ncbi:MAG: hypothetical protein RL659_1298 [Pseudomonadota bacterium]|jgi:hypothetical protein
MKSNAKPDMHRVDQVGRSISRRLNEHAADLPHDITERLRVARMQALSQRKPEPLRIFVPHLATPGGPGMGNSEEGLNLWSRIASVLPIIFLLLGLATIHIFQNENRANEIAQLDAELLIDDLPPAAYTDPGFLIFLKSNPLESKVPD